MTTTKAFEELTHEDLVSLTDEQVEYYIDRACAEGGVRLLPAECPKMPNPAVPDVKRVAWLALGQHFEREEDATEVARLASGFRRLKMTYMPGKSYSSQWAVDDPDPEKASKVEVIDQHLFETHRLRLDQHEAEMATYHVVKGEYDRISEKRAEVHQSVRGKREAARVAEARRVGMRLEFDRYLELADLNLKVARQFLIRAYPDAEASCPELFSDTMPPPPTRAIRLRGVPHEEEVTA